MTISTTPTEDTSHAYSIAASGHLRRRFVRLRCADRVAAFIGRERESKCDAPLLAAAAKTLVEQNRARIREFFGK